MCCASSGNTLPSCTDKCKQAHNLQLDFLVDAGAEIAIDLNTDIQIAPFDTGGLAGFKWYVSKDAATDEREGEWKVKKCERVASCDELEKAVRFQAHPFSVCADF